jgi:hypothetical protein
MRPFCARARWTEAEAQATTPAGVYARDLLVRSSLTGASTLAQSLADNLIACEACVRPSPGRVCRPDGDIITFLIRSFMVEAALRKLGLAIAERDAGPGQVIGGKSQPDGRNVHEMLLMKIKAPSASKEPFDLATIESVVPAERAFRPMADGKCPMVGG